MAWPHALLSIGKDAHGHQPSATECCTASTKKALQPCHYQINASLATSLSIHPRAQRPLLCQGYLNYYFHILCVQTEKFYDMLGTTSFLTCTIGSLVTGGAGSSTRKVRGQCTPLGSLGIARAFLKMQCIPPPVLRLPLAALDAVCKLHDLRHSSMYRACSERAGACSQGLDRQHMVSRHCMPASMLLCGHAKAIAYV